MLIQLFVEHFEIGHVRPPHSLHFASLRELLKILLVLRNLSQLCISDIRFLTQRLVPFLDYLTVILVLELDETGHTLVIDHFQVV